MGGPVEPRPQYQKKAKNPGLYLVWVVWAGGRGGEGGGGSVEDFNAGCAV